jgi:hypothetical protein
MIRPIGSLQQASTSEDRILFVYRRDRKTVRGAAFLVLVPVLATAGFLLGLRLHSFLGWMAAMLPLFAAGVAANWGLADLLRPTLFELELDHRARTLTLSMGRALAKVRFADVIAVEIAKKDRAWNATLLLADGRRIGLGLSSTLARAEETGGKFSSLIGIEIRRQSGDPGEGEARAGKEPR